MATHEKTYNKSSLSVAITCNHWSLLQGASPELPLIIDLYILQGATPDLPVIIDLYCKVLPVNYSTCNNLSLLQGANPELPLIIELYFKVLLLNYL